MVLLGLPMKKRLRLVTSLNLYQKAVMRILFAYGLTFVSVMDYIYPKRI